MISQPKFFSKFINTSVFNFNELHNLFKKHPKDNIEMIYNNQKYRPYVEELLDYKSSLIFTNSAYIKEVFSDLKKVFELKFPQIKKAAKWDVHIYSSYSGQSTSFNVHVDTADNIILQTEGLSKWHLPNYFDKTLTTGDMLWIPKGIKHGCKPLNRRISLSFAFWYF